MVKTLEKTIKDMCAVQTSTSKNRMGSTTKKRWKTTWPNKQGEAKCPGTNAHRSKKCTWDYRIENKIRTLHWR
nr:unnamed protein product [Callosobruchus analis]